ncbi:MAG: MBL fold metallo-hydrolase [Syntrophorhabdales bacterium]|jgi:glyoxylase-like metal-dependent hydrolase (beta-lactamase superfamily II)
MIEEIVRNVYKVVVPLPIPVVGSMNSYVIVDRDRSLIVDPGMAHDLCFDAVRAAVDELGLDLDKVDFFMTHHHLDHFGLVSRIMADRSVIYIHKAEAMLIERIASRALLADLTHLLHAMGFPEKDPEKVLPELLGEEYRARKPWPFRYVDEGDTIERGGLRFRCLVMPGHTVAHVCLYEPNRAILLSGDVVSPVIQFVSATGNPLQDHLESFSRLDRLNIALALPGHRSTFADIGQRIEQLRTHHEARNDAVLAALKDGGKDAYQLAAGMTWSMPDSGDWETAPEVLKFLAVRDCFARLLYLEARGRAHKETRTRAWVYSLTQGADP